MYILSLYFNAVMFTALRIHSPPMVPVQIKCHHITSFFFSPPLTPLFGFRIQSKQLLILEMSICLTLSFSFIAEVGPKCLTRSLNNHEIQAHEHVRLKDRRSLGCLFLWLRHIPDSLNYRFLQEILVAAAGLRHQQNLGRNIRFSLSEMILVAKDCISHI